MSFIIHACIVVTYIQSILTPSSWLSLSLSHSHPLTYQIGGTAVSQGREKYDTEISSVGQTCHSTTRQRCLWAVARSDVWSVEMPLLDIVHHSSNQVSLSDKAYRRDNFNSLYTIKLENCRDCNEQMGQRGMKENDQCKISTEINLNLIFMKERISKVFSSNDSCSWTHSAPIGTILIQHKTDDKQSGLPLLISSQMMYSWVWRYMQR